MKTRSPHCPLCLEPIALGKRDPELISCKACHIAFAGLELFDVLPHSETRDGGKILPFGRMVGKGLRLESLRVLLKNMEHVFELLVTGQAPGEACSEDHLTAYLVSLGEGQRGLLEETLAGSWAMARERHVPKGLQDELIYLPTYLAVATLSFVSREQPMLAREVPALQPTLEKGIDFASSRGLAGPGYDWLDWRKRILTLFLRGHVLDLLQERPDASSRMCYVLGYVHRRTVEILTRNPSGPIEYETRGPVSRDVYEWIAEHTRAFEHFSEEEHHHPY
jgi:hypothetical protein